MKKTILRTIIVMTLALIMAAVLTSCGGKEVKLTINDAGTSTEITAQTGKRISDILEQAEITLTDKDETEPASDSKLTEEITEILIKRYAKVTVIKENKQKDVELVGGTVEDAIKQSGLGLNDGEIVDADLDAFLKDGMKIVIAKGVKVSLTVDGKTSDISVAKGITVKQLLDEQKIELGEDDVCTEKLDAEVTDGMELAVKRVSYKEETKTETIEFETKTEYSSSLDSGKSQVKQEGSNGEKEVTYKVKYVDGKEISREVVSEKIIKEAVNKIVTYGTKGASSQSSSSSSSSSSQQSGGKTVVSKVPVYDCDGSGHGYYEITYSDGSQEWIVF